MSKKPKTILNFGKNPPHVSLKNVIEYLDAAVKGGGTTGSFDDLTKNVSDKDVKVIVASITESNGYTKHKYLKTEADGYKPNNLLSLPLCS